MRTIDIIQKKRDGQALSEQEIHYLIRGYSQGEIPDYQMSAWAMAVYFQGMTPKETADLTMAMAQSGDLIDLSSITGIKVDKHSTGGVGDTTTLVIAPLVAAAGVPVAKMSGRGLGHTGGTIDKLEAIEGFSVERTREQFIDQVNSDGVAVISQSGNITPADKQLYALRDVTATVNSIPLIASSIMSKKIASGADAIVLDVKTGKGAFMKTLEKSIELAKAMVEIGEEVGRETIAIVSDMDQPLGYAVGNALEVKEAIDTLKGQGPKDLEELCLVLGAYMLIAGKKTEDYNDARARLQQLISSGEALEKLKTFVSAQGGNAQMIEEPELLPKAERIIPVIYKSSGIHANTQSNTHGNLNGNLHGSTQENTHFVTSIEAEAIGIAAMMLGAGRETKTSIIDPSVGVVLKKKVGDPIQEGDTLAELHVNGEKASGEEMATKQDTARNGERSRAGESAWIEIERRVREAYTISAEPPKQVPLIYAVVTKNGVELK